MSVNKINKYNIKWLNICYIDVNNVTHIKSEGIHLPIQILVLK